MAAPRRGRGRRPADEVRTSIVEAAGRLLLAEGMSSFTVERVAVLAAVSKMTIYKWWPSKGALALDGYFAVVEATLVFPDSGDIETDLTAQLSAFVHLLTQTPAGHAIAELIGQAQTDPDLGLAYRERYSRPRRALAVQALDRAKARGQLQPDVVSEVVVDQLWGACYHRLLLPDQPLSDPFAHELVRNLIHGVAGPGVPQRLAGQAEAPQPSVGVAELKRFATRISPEPDGVVEGGDQQRLAEEFHAALTTGDWDRLRAILDVEAEWTLPGDNHISGTARGADAVVARAELIASYGLDFALEHTLVSRDNMALALHNTARRGDLVLDEHLATVCRLHNGRIATIETYLSDLSGMNAFFAEAPPESGG